MRIWFSVVVLMLCASASADVVTMGNGDKISGTIEEVNPKSVIVTTKYAGKLTIERSAVKTLQSEAKVKVIKEGSEPEEAYLAPVLEGTGWRQVSVPVPAAPVRATRYLYMGPDWKNQLAIGMVNTTGNDNTTTVNGELTFHYEKRPDELTLKFQTLYGRSNGAQTAGLFDQNLVYRHDISQHWYLYADDDARYDAIKGLSAQVSASVGLGRYLIRTDKVKLDVRAGPAVTYTQRFDGSSDVAPAAEAAVRAAYVVNDHVSLTHETTYITSVIDMEDWRVHSETATNFKLDLERGLGLKLAYADDYENEPSAGRKRNDTRLTLALTFDF